jgi:integral membrane sensor domain MASE1
LNNYNNTTGILETFFANKSQWITGIGISVVYIILARLGLTFTVVADNVTLIWPPSGLALFALLVLGIRYWPWIALGAFVANFTTGISVYACFGIAVGNTMEAVVGLYLLRRFGFDNHLSHVRDVLYLALFAAGFSTMVSASLGALSLASVGVISWSAYPNAWLAWWMGDAMGILAFTPFFLSWWYKYPKRMT